MLCKRHIINLSFLLPWKVSLLCLSVHVGTMESLIYNHQWLNKIIHFHQWLNKVWFLSYSHTECTILKTKLSWCIKSTKFQCNLSTFATKKGGDLPIFGVSFQNPDRSRISVNGVILFYEYYESQNWETSILKMNWWGFFVFLFLFFFFVDSQNELVGFFCVFFFFL